MTYKGALIREAEARTTAATPSFNIPGTDVKVTGAKWVEWWKAANKDERSAAVKNYEYAVAQGFKGSFEQFQNNSWTTNQKDYQAAKAGGYTGSFNEWLLQMKKAGAPDKLKTPSPVTWTTATNELTKRFGKLDPTGMWAVTSELQASHRLAQKILVELKDRGYEPLRSVNMSEEYANKYYNTLNSISEEAKKIKDEATRRRYILEQTKTINSIFKSQLGFSPGE